jgi:predicted unusual protein kinase regulating ubiquinone biosynthesis (AarF/ABC1/UbiB family)
MSTDPATPDLRTAVGQLVASMKDTAREAALLLRDVGGRLDALSLDLARDVGAVSRDASAFARDAATSASAAAEQVAGLYRATPRAARLAQVAAGLLARQRWLRLAAAARGEATLSDEDQRDLARRATAHAAQLRGGVAKLGQLASCRPDLVGAIWARELATLQDDVPPVATAAIKARIEAELGRPLAEVFADVDDVPLAAASLAQVHGGHLLDGTAVAIKVQVPGIEDVIDADVAALRALATTVGELPGTDVAMLTDELARALTAELDYRAEACALTQFADAGVVVPRPIAAASTGRVLTMTRLDGERLTAHLDRLTAAGDLAARDRVLAALVGELAAQILVRGHVHGDPHPGNILVTADGQLAMLDFGCTLTLAPAERAAYARLVIAVAGGNTAAAARELAALGFVADDPARLVELTSSLIGALRPGAAAADLDWEAAFASQLATARALGGLTIPRSFVLLGRVLATVAGLLATYRPELHLHPLIAPHLMAALG